MQELLLRLLLILLVAVGVYICLLQIAKHLFPKQEEEQYLGGKKKESSNKLWMD